MAEDDTSAAFQAAVDVAAKEYEADIYLYSGPIHDAGYGKLVSAIAKCLSEIILNPMNRL
jgi:hypothetical protein